MQRCECGNDRLVPSERRITIDRGVVFERPMPAVQCDVCGKMFVEDEARQLLLKEQAPDE